MSGRTNKLHKQGHSVVVTVPHRLLKTLQWKLGTEVFVEEIDGRLVVTDVDRRIQDRISAQLAARMQEAARR